MPNITNLRRTNGGITYYEEDGEIFEVTQNSLGKPASIQSRRGKWTEEKSVFSYDSSGRFLGLTGDIETTLLPALLAEAAGTASYATDPLTGAVTGLVGPGGPVGGTFALQTGAASVTQLNVSGRPSVVSVGSQSVTINYDAFGVSGWTDVLSTFSIQRDVVGNIVGASVTGA